jgi:hypothetical protein
MFKTEELEINGVPRLGITLDRYPDVSFVVGAVQFNEVDGQLRISYNYDVVEGAVPSDKQSFEHAIGDFVVWYLKNQQSEAPVAYYGGLDEN